MSSHVIIIGGGISGTATAYELARNGVNVTLLASRGHVNLRRPAREFFGDLFSNPSYQAHALEINQRGTRGHSRRSPP